MKTTVVVSLVARKTVYITVEHGLDEDPCDLNAAEELEAIERFELGQYPTIDVEFVTKASRRAADEVTR